MGKVDQKASRICSVLASYEPVDITADLTGWLVCFTTQRIHTYVRPEGNALPLCVKFEAAQFTCMAELGVFSSLFFHFYQKKGINKLLENTQPTKKILHIATFNFCSSTLFRITRDSGKMCAQRFKRPEEMAQLVKVIAAKPDGLSSIPRNHTVGTDNRHL